MRITILGLNAEGRKELLGLYCSQSEGANYWLSVLTDLHNRGIQDILIACVDGLKGFPETIGAVFPETEVQLCACKILKGIRSATACATWRVKIKRHSSVTSNPFTKQQRKKRQKWRWRN